MDGREACVRQAQPQASVTRMPGNGKDRCGRFGELDIKSVSNFRPLLSPAYPTHLVASSLTLHAAGEVVR